MDGDGDRKQSNIDRSLLSKKFGGGNAAGITSGCLHPPPASSSSTWKSSSKPHYNLLTNIMFDYIPVIYCIATPCVELLLVHGNCGIVIFDGCIHIYYLLWWYYVLMYECTYMLADCIRLSLLDWLGGGLVNDIKMCPNLSSIYRG
jgi:hypothetical protein